MRLTLQKIGTSMDNQKCRGTSSYYEHLSTNLNISQQERGLVLYLVHT